MPIPHIPLEIWLMIATYISEQDFQKLIGLNVYFYNIIMDARYKEVYIGYISDYMLKKLARLK
jgi:hypothetical protein